MFIQLQNNRPFIRGKGLKYKRLTWKIEGGEVKFQSNLDQAIIQIERYLEPGPYDITFKNPLPELQNRKKRKPGGTTLGERKASN
jgi:hypothetical protein